MANATGISNVSSTLLPTEVSGPIFDRVLESSAITQLARRVQLPLVGNTSIPVSMDVPTAGWVSEGGAKPVGAGAVGIKQMTAKKVTLLLPVSEELALANPGGLYDQLQQDLPVAISRAFDHAAIHGKDLRSGGAGPFTDFLKMTSQSVELGTASQANGGKYADLVNVEKAVVNAGFDFTGWAVDPMLKPELKLSVDTTGRPLWVDGVDGASLLGYMAGYNRGVSGKYQRHGNNVQVITLTGSPTGGNFTLANNFGQSYVAAYNVTTANLQTAIRAWGGIFAGVTVTGTAGSTYTLTFGTTGAPISVAASALTGGTTPTTVIGQSASVDTKLRAVGGDWGQCAFGIGRDISVRISNEASYVDEASVTHSAFQENLVLLLVEAYFGFVVGNVNAFAVLTDAS
jgi:hypothetical protein